MPVLRQAQTCLAAQQQVDDGLLSTEDSKREGCSTRPPDSSHTRYQLRSAARSAVDGGPSCRLLSPCGSGVALALDRDRVRVGPGC